MGPGPPPTGGVGTPLHTNEDWTPLSDVVWYPVWNWNNNVQTTVKKVIGVILPIFYSMGIGSGGVGVLSGADRWRQLISEEFHKSIANLQVRLGRG